MDQFQPLRDTIGLLAGTGVRRANRPSETLNLSQKTYARLIGSLLTLLFVAIMLGVRLAG